MTGYNARKGAGERSGPRAWRALEVTVRSRDCGLVEMQASGGF